LFLSFFYSSAVGFAASQTGCTLLASLVMEKAGRRTFLMASSFVMFARLVNTFYFCHIFLVTGLTDGQNHHLCVSLFSPNVFSQFPLNRP
jgi:hypothetical protein